MDSMFLIEQGEEAFNNIPVGCIIYKWHYLKCRGIRAFSSVLWGSPGTNVNFHNRNVYLGQDKTNKQKSTRFQTTFHTLLQEETLHLILVYSQNERFVFILKNDRPDDLKFVVTDPHTLHFVLRFY